MSSEYFYDCLNTHNCGYSFTSSKEERHCTRCDSSFIDLRRVGSKCEDNISNIEKYYMDKVTWIQLMTKDRKDVFTPERLLGVETNTGFITYVEERFYMGYQARVTTTKGFSYFMETLDYYISDDSDETVSFEEYVNRFYKTK